MRKQRSVSLILTVVLIVFSMLLGGCGTPAPQVSTTPSTSAPAPASASESSAAAPAATSAQTVVLDNHEVYTHLDDTAFQGVAKPTMADRTSIKKNLPVKQKKNVVVGWSCPSMGSSYFAGIKIGAEEEAKKYGYTLKFLVADNFNSNKQTSDIESLVTQGVDILIVDPADNQAQLTDVQRAIAKGIPVMASGVPFDQSAPVITTVVSNNYEGGYATGLYCAKYFKDAIKMATIPGLIGHPVSNSRLNGFLAGWVYGKMQLKGTAKEYREDAMLEGYKYYKELVASGKIDMSKYDCTVVGTANGTWSEVDGMKAAEDLLTANPNISLIFGENDHIGIGAAKVLEQRKLTGKVQIACAADGDTKAIELVRDGVLLTSGYNNPVVIAKRALDLVHMMFEEGYDANNMPIITQLPVICITKDNWKDVYAQGSDYAKELDVPFKTIPEINAAKSK